MTYFNIFCLFFFFFGVDDFNLTTFLLMEQRSDLSVTMWGGKKLWWRVWSSFFVILSHTHFLWWFTESVETVSQTQWLIFIARVKKHLRALKTGGGGYPQQLWACLVCSALTAAGRLTACWGFGTGEGIAAAPVAPWRSQLQSNPGVSIQYPKHQKSPQHQKRPVICCQSLLTKPSNQDDLKSGQSEWERPQVGDTDPWIWSTASHKCHQQRFFHPTDVPQGGKFSFGIRLTKGAGGLRRGQNNIGDGTGRDLQSGEGLGFIKKTKNGKWKINGCIYIVYHEDIFLCRQF